MFAGFFDYKKGLVIDRKSKYLIMFAGFSDYKKGLEHYENKLTKLASFGIN